MNTYHVARCDKCKRSQKSSARQTRKAFLAQLREDKWWAGKKQVLCPDHRPVVADPKGAAERWAEGMAELTGLPLGVVKQSAVFQKYSESVKG